MQSAQGQHGFGGISGAGRIAEGTANWWQTINRHKTMPQGCHDFGFALDCVSRDPGICPDTAKAIKHPCR